MQAATWAHRAADAARLCRAVASSAQVTGSLLQRVELGSSTQLSRSKEVLDDGCSTSGRLPASTPCRSQYCGFTALAVMGAASQQRGFSSHAEYAEIPPEFEIRPGPIAAYEKLVEGGVMNEDDHQEAALVLLQNLYEELVHMVDQRPEGRNYGSDSRDNWWSRLVGLSHRSGAVPVRGLYLYGGVGTGKTMLMDMFYKELPESIAKTRIHFHDFMLDVHGRLQKLRSLPDPLEAVATQVTRDIKLLCLDEFMVTDVADAMILNRLFQHLFSKGLVLVSTSNRGPDRLYEGGLQRQLFLPFIETLKQRCVVHEIGSTTDYRRLTEAQLGLFFYGQGASEMLEAKFNLITENAQLRPTTVQVAMGRRIEAAKAAGARAFFEFTELCEMPLGAADYIALCNHFHTLAIDDVPVFGASNRSAAYRFATLIDVMYEHKTRLLCSAEATPVELFDRVVTYADRPNQRSSRSWENERADVLVDNELGFAKDRIISRLTEMQSLDYLEDWSQRHFHTDSHEDAAENQAAQG